MRGPRIAVALVLLALAVPTAATSSLRGGSLTIVPEPAPVGLKGFMTRYDEPTRHTFPSEPAFAWGPSANAQHYEFELARSSSFRDNAIIYHNDSLLSPTASIPITLPWTSAT